MAGLDNNTTILAATNQLIKAINDLADKVGAGNDLALNRIGDAIEAQTTMLETRSVAETVAQNTNFSNLIASVDNLDLSTTVNVNTDNLVTAIQNCCVGFQAKLDAMISAIKNIRLQPGIGPDTGGPFLDEPIADPPLPGDPANENEYMCAAANYIWQCMYDALMVIASLNSVRQEFTEKYAIVLLTTAFVALFVPGGIIADIIILLVAALGAAQNWYILKYFEDLANEFQSGKNDLVCGLYTAAQNNSPEQAKAAIDSFIDNAIDGVIQIDYGIDLPAPFWGLFDACMRSVSKKLAGNYLLNTLFVCSADVDAYSADNPGLDCSECGGCVTFNFAESAEGWVSSSVTNDNTVSNQWVTDFLRTEITKSAATTAIGYWDYTPNDSWIVTAGDSITAQFFLVQTDATGAVLRVVFTDATSQQQYQETLSNGTRYDFEIIILAEHTGKEIDYIQLEFHSGSAANQGTAIGAWEFCEVCLSAGI